MKKLLASFTFAAASLMVAVPAAQAADYTIAPSVLSSATGYFGSFNYGESGFNDNFTFTLSEPLSSFSSIAFKFAFGDGSQLTNFIGQLTGPDAFSQYLTYSSVPSGTPGLVTQSLSFLGNLGAGTYTLNLSATASAAGQYSAYMVASPVPEPESYAMMLAGLAVMGAIARKRSQNKA